MPWSEVLAPELPASDVRSAQANATQRILLHLRKPTEPRVMECNAPEQAYRLQHAIYRCLSTHRQKSVLSSNLAGGSVEDAALPQEVVRSFL